MLNSIAAACPSLAKIPFRIIIIWIAVVGVGYYLLSPPSHPYAAYSHTTQSALLSGHTKPYMPQAIVFIAMGKLSAMPTVEDAISSCRLIGHWTEHIYILTDRKACFDDIVKRSPLTEVIYVPSKASIMEIKTMKAEIFTYLPQHIERVLYMDVDILLTRNIGFFLTDLTHQLFYYHNEQVRQRQHQQQLENAGKPTVKVAVAGTSKGNASHAHVQPTTLPELDLDFASFLDAKGHYVGFCAGCEKWHTGVMYLTRRSAEQPNSCLKAWATVLSSGMYTTDQESLDFTERNMSCPHVVAMPTRHLLFAKDYIGMLFTSGQTFIHLTAVNHKEDQDYFYREIVVPRIRNALHPPLKPYDPTRIKTC